VPQAIASSGQSSLTRAGFSVTAASVRASEANKTLDTVARLLHQIASTRHERSDPVVALGGGVVGDISGFVAATYRRGVPIVQCPTTLLAMVDASVGGKTGVNLALPGGLVAKNLAGAFWQPAQVLADTTALASLPERVFRSGLAECLKHGLLSHEVDQNLFSWTSQNLVRFRLGESASLPELIERNVRVKAWFVERDERENPAQSGPGRVLLNLGHTFAHAIETLPGLSPDGRPENSPLQHGEAVAFGLVAAAATAHALGRLSAEDRDSVRVAVERLGMESRLVGLPPDDLIVEAMSHDKKVSGGRLRLVLPASLGRCEVVEDPPVSVVQVGLAAIRA